MIQAGMFVAQLRLLVFMNARFSVISDSFHGIITDMVTGVN